MPWKETLERFREALRVEVRKRHGRIAEIEERAGMRPGELSHFYSGRKKNEIGALLRALDALEIEYGSFFSRVLGYHGRPEDYLAQLEVGAEEDDVKLAVLERAAIRLEAEIPLPSDQLAVKADIATLLSDIVCCERREQERRLRMSRRYRSHGFARAYLEHLDSLRYDAPDDAGKLASWVIRGLLPRLGEPVPERLELLCLALGIYGSARRVRGRFPAAAHVLRLGLELSRRRRLRRTTAELLQRASYVLRDLGQFERALAYLQEALVIYVELGSNLGIGKTLVDRGMMLNFLGDYERAIASLRRALDTIQGCGSPRNKFAAYQYLAIAYEQSGDLQSAERQLRIATGVPELERGFYCGKLTWQQGTIALKRGNPKRAESLLRAAREILAPTENPGQEALVSLDLLDALLAQGKLVEADQLAHSMVYLLEVFETHRGASQAMIKLIRPALAGRISRVLVAEARIALEASGAVPGATQAL